MKTLLAATAFAGALLGASSANAQSGLLLGVSRGAGAAPSFTVTYGTTADQNSGNDGSFQYTTAALSIGAANSHRQVCVAVSISYATNKAISGITIGGVTATGIETSAAFTRTIDFYCAVVPTGTTAVVVITSTGASLRMALDYWMILNANGDTYDARSGTGTPTGGTTTVVPAVTPTSTSAIVIAVSRFAATTTATSWTQDAGASGTQDSDHSVSTTIRQSGYRVSPGIASTINYTATGTAAATALGFAVSFKP